MKNKVAHIVNLGVFPENSDLHIAQPITVETMRIAKDFAAGSVDVNLLSAQFAEDHHVIPTQFIATSDLDRSVLDIRDFIVKRKLPLIKDILDRAYDAVESDYIIYTNVDIGILPSFYITVNKITESGFDAFAINRRTISQMHSGIEDIPLMYAEVGSSHLGYDCFIFRRDVYKKFDLGLICVGAPNIGKVMLVNQILNAKNFKIFHDQHITFHIGRDRIWASKQLLDYKIHNQREFKKVITMLDKAQQGLVQKWLTRDRLQGLRHRLGDYIRGNL